MLSVGAAIGATACQDLSAPTPQGLESPKPSFAFQANATVTPPFSDVSVAGGLTNPTLMAIAPDGRIFVSEQAGTVRVIKNGALLGTPFVTLNVNSSGERGALGIAFDPAFATNHFVYIYYTSSSGPHNRVSRFTANGDVASGGETMLLDLPTLGATNHNGGAIHFGADGKLYIAVGENANGSNSQIMTTPLGKMLRINSDGTIPSDNPFFGSTSGINRAIWALGLRNPFTFAFQAGTGRLFINDVGEQTWEEIDDGLAGANYGWPSSEGNTSNPSFTSPFYTYNHNIGACAITGGDFYNPTTVMFPASYVGDYFFADFCGGFIKSIDLTTKTVTTLATGITSPTDLHIGNDGALYYVSRAGPGEIRKIIYASSTGPSISQQPANQSVAVGASATFTVVASGTAPLSYQWQRNQVNINGAISASYMLMNAQLADNGAKFRCIVTNSVSSATSNEATLTVTSNPPPGQTYEAENAVLSGPVVSTQNPGYSGTGYIVFTNASADYVKWVANVTVEGVKSLDFRYALAGTTPRTLQLILNGKVIKAALSFPATGSATTWGVVTATARLTTGPNNVRLTAIGNGGPNLDNLTVRP
ncbi:MAG: PQQ-dependent sugar dehydrogenase [Gemmatimonadota bacterium]